MQVQPQAHGILRGPGKAFLAQTTRAELMAVAWAYGTRLLRLPANAVTGAAWGAILWLLALLMMSTVGVVHPAIRRGKQADPGPAATHFGKLTPLGSLLGHLVYGLVLGVAYSRWPLGRGR